MSSRHDGTQLKDLPPVVRESLLRCTPQERRFVVAYCGRAAGNGTLAVKLAGGKGDYGSRAALASALIRKEAVRVAIDAWMTTFATSGAEVTTAIADMARCSLEPFLEIEPIRRTTKVARGTRGKPGKSTVVETGGGVRLRKQTDESWARHAHWIKTIKCDPKTGRVTDLQVHDRLKALEMQAKVLKLYTDAPQINNFMYMQSLSDDDLLKEYEQAWREAGLGVQPNNRMN